MYVIKVHQEYDWSYTEHDSITRIIGIFEHIKDAEEAANKFVYTNFRIENRFYDTIGGFQQMSFIYYSRELDTNVSMFVTIEHAPMNTIYDTNNIIF